MEPADPNPHREANLVRPYTLTAGRTEASVDLPLEAQIQTVQSALFHRWPPNDLNAKIIGLCIKSPSVAEISARLDVPLGVARVLIGDLVTGGYLQVHTTLTDSSTKDERVELIGRTLRGLRAL
ncbi:DUF742 domain-containing protein [Mycolicibacterium mengxianglii]|uniref:DUF742 domain-containing protein n=1 Tax=Mycolicibacterium mengxianglii TaxID=2736649 RepID=UPI0018D04F16|nr:DUF742 domain-containing protein [Mycolicibacterium mengxianglii]